MLKRLMVGAAGLALFGAMPASAATVLTFEGIGDQQPVGNFYAGQGFTFSDATLAIIDSDAGGTGNIANEPSPSTVMFFLDTNNAILNAVNGFDTGFSFLYSSSTSAVVNVWSGLNATGKLLGSIDLTAQYSNGCTGDPFGDFCNWTNGGLSFAGTAHSIDFGGTANRTAYDNITFGSATAGGGDPVGAVPEAATWAMMIAGCGLIGAAVRRRRQPALRLSYT
jgi:hypothetical protein